MKLYLFHNIGKMDFLMLNKSKINFDEDISFSRFDTAIEWLLISLLAFMPLAFGVVHAWSEEIVIIISGAIVMCFLLKFLFNRKHEIIWTWAYIPLGIFLILVVIQLIPLPEWLVSTVSGNTAAMKKELLGDLPDSDKLLKSITLTFYPFATKHDLRLILALAGVFFVVLNEFNRPAKIKRLLKAIVFIGTFIALISLGQNILGNGKIYWFVENHHSKSYSGSFVNHSHYGQFMNLSIGAAFGLLFARLHEVFQNKEITLPAVFNYLSSKSSYFIWFIIITIGLSMATVFLSLTRGGIISMLIAMCLMTLIFSSQSHLRSHGWIMVGVAIVAFICILYIGFDAVYERMATLRELNKAGQNRMQMLRDTAVAWSKFPLFGTGLGTYSVVYPMFDNTHITTLASHAENEYAQAAEETGLIGLSLLLIFLVIVGFSFVRNIRHIKFPIQSVTYGLCFGLIAILIHSFSDFGQHLPANSFLSIIFCALLISISQYGRSENVRKVYLSNRFINLLIFLCVCIVFVWSLFGANKGCLAEEHRKEIQAIEKSLVKTNWEADENVYDELIGHAAAVCELEPDNIHNLYMLDVYRWRQINRTQSPDISKISFSNSTISSIRQINKHLNMSRKYCPTYGPVYTLSGQIEKFILDDDSGEEKIRKGYLLAPCNPIACFVAGSLDIYEGEYENCFPKFDRAVQLNSRFYNDVVRIYIENLSRPYKAISLAGDNIDRLKHLVSLFTDSRYNDLAEQCRMKVKNLLEEKCSTPKANASDNASLAGIYKQLNDNTSAIEYYRRALTLDYSHISWRLELARLFAKTGNVPEAISQARICLRISPSSKEAEKLLSDLSLSPEGWSKETNSY